ncbi:fimbrial usher protein PixC [Escherichia coli]|nr:FimD/PapC C-terminal domain-containing protein [Escherichia coli]STG02105.1 fimbrial usher protein PixC [Escherichia coli]
MLQGLKSEGSRLFAVLRLADNSHPPFGASVTKRERRELGMVADSGLAWLSGVNRVKPECRLGRPTQWCGGYPGTSDPAQQLLLPCRQVK